MQPREQHNTDGPAQELLHLQQQIRHLIESLPIGIAIVNALGIIEAVNPAIVSLFGYDGRELAGRDITILLRNAPWSDGGLKVWHNSSSSRALELEGQSKDAEVIPIEVTISRFETAGRERLIIMVQDVTERFLANKLKEDFFHMINHDIRAPLTNVGLFLELLEADEVVSTLPQVGETRIRAAKKNVQRIQDLTTGLLELNRLESSVGIVQMAPMSVRMLVDSSVTGVAQAAAAKAIKIDTTNVDDAAIIQGDYGKLEQVMTNLLSNAITHSVSGQPIELKASVHSGSIKISIRDRGTGVPDDEKDSIFDKYKQGSTKSSGGYGLGLAICKEIVRQHGGNIGCEDAPDGGSIFWFELPASTGA